MKIHIVLFASETYMVGLSVTALSIAKSAQHPENLVFHVITGENVSDTTYNRLVQRMYCVHPDTQVIREPWSEAVLAGLPDWHGATMTWLRVFLPETLPADIDWVLCVDSDILAMRPVEELYAMRDDTKLLCAVRATENATLAAEDSAWIRRHLAEDVAETDYFNAGVLLMNLKRMRECDLVAKARAIIVQHKAIPLFDQTVLNAICQKETKFIPPTFNISQMRLSQEDLTNGGWIHYLIQAPWRNNMFPFFSGRILLWHTFADSALYDRPNGSIRTLFSPVRRLEKRVLYWICKLDILWYIFYPFFRIRRNDPYRAFREPVLNDVCPREKDSLVTILRKHKLLP